jgi:hypothetical protein
MQDAMYNRIPANPEARTLYIAGLNARAALQSGLISYEEAKKVIEQYVSFVNNKAKLMAKKYNQRYKPVCSVGAFLR